ncbi:SUMF1/EgtB/PvdO family nonheme iron enzyme [Sorangium sp. So ce834]|uniref:SUMF1/EgtB/PvdO family nonheme iron enzyme n=1 Tax=Sorangium sp. So ce834 TaxID=3133321 RepID=UPI003F632025
MAYLSEDRIMAIYEAAVASGLAAQQDALVAGLPTAYVAILPAPVQPAARLLQTLHAMNALPALADGTVPLMTWLRNARMLAATLPQGRVFEDSLAQLVGTAARAASGAAPATQARATESACSPGSTKTGSTPAAASGVTIGGSVSESVVVVGGSNSISIVPLSSDAPPSEERAHLRDTNNVSRGRIDTATAIGTCIAFLGALVARWLERPCMSLAILGAVGVAFLIGQYIDSIHRFALRNHLLRLGDWLQRAGMTDLVGLADWFLDKVYGRELLSRRALWITLILVASLMIPIGVVTIITAVIELGDPWIPLLTQTTLFITPSLFTFTLVSYSSLWLTRTMLRSIQISPSWPRLLRGFVLGAVVLAGVSYVAFELTPYRLLTVTYDGGAAHFRSLLVPAVEHLGMLASGAIQVDRLHLSGGLPVFFASLAWTALVALFPLIVLLSILASAFAHRITGRLVLPLGGRLARTIAGDPAGPLSRLYLPAVAAAAIWSFESLRTPEPPMNLSWSAVSAGEYEIGAPETSPMHAIDQPRRRTNLTWAFEITQTEIPQDWWLWIWNQNPQQARRWKLPRRPWTYIGDELPVETVSWCETARFLNLWSLVESRTPVYCSGDSCVPDEGPGFRAGAGLDGCEAGAVIHVRWTADGYRLPTADEWEIAARGKSTTEYWPGDTFDDLSRVGWHNRNSPLHPMPVGLKPPNPFGLRDVHGNVWEWVWDEFRVPHSWAAELDAMQRGEKPPQGNGLHDVTSDAQMALLKEGSTNFRLLQAAKQQSRLPMRCTRGGGYLANEWYSRSAGPYLGNNVRMRRSDIGFRAVRRAAP